MHSILTPSQRQASEHFKGPALTLAIPGSGKTTLLLHRLIQLVETHDVPSNQILTLTFSKASADDMKSRYDERFSHLGYHFSFMTIHKFAYGIVKQYMKHTGQVMTLLDDTGKRFHIINQIYNQYYKSPMTEDDFETITNHFGLIYNLRLKKEDFKDYDFKYEHIFKMIEDFHRYKKKHHLMDFDDMILYAVQILEHNPKALAFFRHQYPFIQVDEAQDTSKLQYALIEMLTENLFIVADDDQSIYGFRGAYPQYLLDFPTRYKDAKVYYLKDNFRSNANIVTCSKAIIELNQTRFDKPMEAFHEPATLPAMITFDDMVRRNNYLLDCLNGSEESSAILYRNRVSSLSLINLLEEADLDYYIKDPPLSELNHWMLNDLLQFMLLAMMPQDLESFNKIAYKTNAFISREMVDYVNTQGGIRNIFDLLIQAPFLQDYQTRTQEKLKANFEALQRLRPYDAIHFIETELGYLDYLKQNTDRYGYTMNFARTRLDAYKAIAKKQKSTFEFISKIDALKENVLKRSKKDAAQLITLSTIHGSKGLEFDNVYMIDVNDQIFPGPSPDTLEEERRLFYVGITRAKKHFELLHIDFINGGYNKPSQFIKEFLRQTVANDRIDQSGRKASVS